VIAICAKQAGASRTNNKNASSALTNRIVILNFKIGYLSIVAFSGLLHTPVAACAIHTRLAVKRSIEVKEQPAGR
jgi:hypothetical protein